MRIGTVRLNVRDLAVVANFYERVLGLHRLDSSDHTATLGSGETPLLELAGDAGLAPRDLRAAGLFHTAFLMPSRAHLARWVGFVTEARVPLRGASDHNVSEAIYLADPEGNGIEVYADRPVGRWRAPDGQIDMPTERLDLQALVAAASGTPWDGFPEEGFIGHVHLQVGDTAELERFYHGVLGFDVMTRYPGASFLGSGGYHHHVAGNVWTSRGAVRRPERMAGLDGFGLVVKDPAARAAIVARAERAGIMVEGGPEAPTLRDPWGARITLTPTH